MLCLWCADEIRMSLVVAGLAFEPVLVLGKDLTDTSRAKLGSLFEVLLQEFPEAVKRRLTQLVVSRVDCCMVGSTWQDVNQSE